MANKRTRNTPDSSSSEAEDGLESSKYAHVEPATSQQRAVAAIRCFLPPHRPYSFSTYEEFDNHYYKSHVNRCSDCDKNFPSNHFLQLHISEVHDSLAEAKRARGDKTFGCFVEDCDKLCYTPQKRRLHLIDKHHFPKNYNFFITKDGLDKRHSLLVPSTRQRKLSQQTSDGPASNDDEGTAAASTKPEHDTDQTAEEEPESPAVSSTSQSPEAEAIMTPSSSTDADLDSLTHNMSSLRFVPNSVRFGRGGRTRRGQGLAKK